MIKFLQLLSLILLSALSSVAMADVFSDSKPAGFLWYNLPKKSKEPVKQPSKGVPFSTLSYSDRDKVLHFYTMEALHKARQTKSLEDMRTFLVLQDYWMKESSRFSQLFQKALVYYPEFDYSVTHPTSNLGAKWLDESRMEKREQVIHALSKTHGILFFYRGSNAFDSKEIPIIRDFCTRFGLSLIPVSVDGVASHEFNDSRNDSGQANSLGVRYFPAVLLVDVQKNETLPVAYGLTTQDVLEKRLFQVATHFEGEGV